MNKYYLDIKVADLNVKCLIQIKGANDINIGQGRIKKILKTMYHIYYRCNNYSIKKDDLKYNIHGQVCIDINKLKKIK